MGKGKNTIPERWLDYQPLGECIEGTKIVPFKVPLKTHLCQRHLPENEWFTPAMLLERQPKLKTIIDLTNTFRYYNGEEEFGTKGVDHVKIMVEGRGSIPRVSQLQQFFGAVDHHMEKYKDNNDALVGVHCTHGLNRTGYFICRWILERMKIEPDDAIQRFNIARGHPIERQTLLNDLKKKNHPPVPRIAQVPKLPPVPKTNEYRSPLDDCSYDDQSTQSRYGRYGGGDRYNHHHQNRNDKDNNFRNHNEQFNRDSHMKPNNSFKRNKGSRNMGPSRADLDTNWRARDRDVESEHKDEERPYYGGRGKFRKWKGKGKGKEKPRNDSGGNRSPLKRD